jgi:hypothetical protein
MCSEGKFKMEMRIRIQISYGNHTAMMYQLCWQMDSQELKAIPHFEMTSLLHAEFPNYYSYLASDLNVAGMLFYQPHLNKQK